MERILVSAPALRVLLNLELATLDFCEGVEVQKLLVHPVADADGCNWEVAAYSGLPRDEQHRSLVEAVIASQRYRYNVGKRG
jgi:hypothetical protein